MIRHCTFKVFYNDLSMKFSLMTRLMSCYRNSNNVICVELYDTEQAEDVNISQVLVDTGFAKQLDSVTFKRPLPPASKQLASEKPRFVPG